MFKVILENSGGPLDETTIKAKEGDDSLLAGIVAWLCEVGELRHGDVIRIRDLTAE